MSDCNQVQEKVLDVALESRLCLAVGVLRGAGFPDASKAVLEAIELLRNVTETKL